MRRFVSRLTAATRDAWLIVGATLALFLILEGAFRLQAVARRGIGGRASETGSAPAIHPHANEDWWREISSGSDAPDGGGVRFDPFRGWWPLPQRSRHINVDSSGRRVTIQPQPTSPRRRQIAMFGGSVMWGWVVRDSSTIPSLVASRLHQLGYHDLTVVNHGQTMFDLAQSVATLMLELRRGNVPAVAVFLDGNNEVAPAYQTGDVGHVLNEARMAARFDRRTFGSDARRLLGHSAIVTRLMRGAGKPWPGNESLCPAVAASYARQIRAVDALAREHGFVAIFLWQPMLATSGKRMTAWERSRLSDSAWTAMVRRCSELADSAVARDPRIAFESLSGFFDADTTSVFIDNYGHITERAGVSLSNRIADIVADQLGTRD